MPSVIPIAPSLFTERGVGHGGGMRDQGLDSAQGFAQRADAHSLQQSCGIRERSGFKRDHRAETGHLLASELVLRMAFQPRVENLLDLLVEREELSDLAAIAVMLQHADGKSLHSAQEPANTQKERGSRPPLSAQILTVRTAPACADDNATQPSL